jgi:hypothetical protein
MIGEARLRGPKGLPAVVTEREPIHALSDHSNRGAPAAYLFARDISGRKASGRLSVVLLIGQVSIYT